MYMRMTRVQSSPDQMDQTITDFTGEVIPVAQRAMGYAGAAIYVNRETGQAAGVTFWESAQALAASELMGIDTRTQAAEATGLNIVDVARFQIVLIDRAQLPRMLAYTRVDNGYMPPERLDAFADFIRNDVVPALRQRNGYCWMTTSVDYTSGVVAVTSNWETADDREMAASSFAPVLRRADEFGLNPIRIDLYEQALLQLLQPLTGRP
jgi:heme-degrading monooxygenase HmoA